MAKEKVGNFTESEWRGGENVQTGPLFTMHAAEQADEGLQRVQGDPARGLLHFVDVEARR